MRNPYQQYKKTSIESASREKILLLMYEGAIRFVKLAINAMEKNNIADKGTYIGRAYDVIMELNNTLDHEVGGELAQNLESLYIFMTDNLTKANINNDKKSLEDVLKILLTLHEGWKQAVEKYKNEETNKQFKDVENK
ncbi:MAG: flagellar export chaperone FliS [Bdellovibrionales bacterium]|nr:flagellar export chaperone FliS [Bdellovibrionales bacterium]